ncbi:MAG TPA: 16S rRNA (guanine(527)-N(7))-methyltransferase RsmG [Saprospiraceae bacterium]|nr:16S rRNA (guanine(527)-N(7))-methyltransferase RsmG [Saprospiraceae bacterium]HRO09769.1 16S rRNA (guanine(527)-N(7))-methyltransferase RsmG [Saprospiraceae bacterium]HRP42935.1 16S rRNA (guanine(527)-N(7))-methyltransferase RsmG [Saprospiraceae bacterium]
MERIHKYFPNLTPEQADQFSRLDGLYREWNDKINVISRKDIDNLYLHHILHSLAIERFITFKDGSHILDLGTGGGLPGIPLAILFPNCTFTLIDSIRKKTVVTQSIVESLGLTNVSVKVGRAEELKEKYDFVVTRAVAKVDVLLPWVRKVLSSKHQNIYPNGLIALKGNLREELKLIKKHEYREVIAITQYFDDPYFEDKYILYIQG